MESVDDWIEDQSCRTSMTDTGWVVLSIEGDRAGRPMVKFGGDGLYSVCVSERAFAPFVGM